MSRSLYYALMLVGAPTVLISSCSHHDPCEFHVDREWCAQAVADWLAGVGMPGAVGEGGKGPHPTGGPGPVGSGGGCVSPDECPDPSGPCKEVTCTGGVCGEVNRTEPDLPDEEGDCRVPSCSDGVVVYKAEFDPPASSDPCMTYTCAGQEVTPHPETQYTTVDGCRDKSRCDGAGQCAAKEGEDCSDSKPCASGVCESGLCRSQIGGPCESNNDCKLDVGALCDDISSCAYGTCKVNDWMSCDTDAQCVSNKCEPNEAGGKEKSCVPCTKHSECDSNFVCGSGTCLPSCTDKGTCAGGGKCMQVDVAEFGCFPACTWG